LKQSRHVWSERLIERAVWLATRVPYRDDVGVVERFLGGHLSASSLGRLIQEYGGRLEAARVAEAGEEAALPQRGSVVPGEQREATRRGIGVDGALVHIRGEGWKEVKVAVVFAYAPVCRSSLVAEPDGPETPELLDISAQSYCACLGDVEAFEPLQWAEASRRRLPQAWEQVAISDGAEWIRRLYERNYGQATPVVDWYHAMEHVWTAGRLVCGEEGPHLTSWVKRRETALWLGQVHEVVRVIRAEAAELSGEPQQKLLTEATYFERNARRMQYQEFREEGLPIGSGMVEGGACKALVGDRLKGTGMRWSRPGAQAMLTLRAELFSQRWEVAWQLACPKFSQLA